MSIDKQKAQAYFGAISQVTNKGGLNQGSRNKGGEKMVSDKCILRLQSIGFAIINH